MPQGEEYMPAKIAINVVGLIILLTNAQAILLACETTNRSSSAASLGMPIPV